MTANFKKVASDELGYEPEAVDRWISLARNQFADPGSHVLDASSLRTAQFGVVKGGYQIAAVDAALDRLDDAFAAQEANRLLVRGGHQGAGERLDYLQALIAGRDARPIRAKFARTKWWLKGYSVRQVDGLVKAIALPDAEADSNLVARLREVTFSPAWGGYSEAQVDAFIDRAVQFMQLARSLG